MSFARSRLAAFRSPFQRSISLSPARFISNHASSQTPKSPASRYRSFQLHERIRTPFRQRRWYSGQPTPDPTPHLGSPPAESLSLSQRLKALGKEYGWTAMGVYLGLSALDFPFCFLAVRLLGPERVGRWEEAVVDAIRYVVHIPFPNLMKKKEAVEGSDGPGDAVLLAAESDARGTASIWTQLGLAYAVHKSLIFFRVPLTAAVLPSVVKTLRSWGYNVGKRTPKK